MEESQERVSLCYIIYIQKHKILNYKYSIIYELMLFLISYGVSMKMMMDEALMKMMADDTMKMMANKILMYDFDYIRLLVIICHLFEFI